MRERYHTKDYISQMKARTAHATKEGQLVVTETSAGFTLYGSFCYPSCGVSISPNILYVCFSRSDSFFFGPAALPSSFLF